MKVFFIVIILFLNSNVIAQTTVWHWNANNFFEWIECGETEGGFEYIFHNSGGDCDNGVYMTRELITVSSASTHHGMCFDFFPPLTCVTSIDFSFAIDHCGYGTSGSPCSDAFDQNCAIVILNFGTYSVAYTMGYRRNSFSPYSYNNYSIVPPLADDAISVHSDPVDGVCYSFHRNLCDDWGSEYPGTIEQVEIIWAQGRNPHSSENPGGRCSFGPITFYSDVPNINNISADNTNIFVCSGDFPVSIGLHSSVNPGECGTMHYTWSPSTGLDNAYSPDPTATFSSAGNYTYTLNVEDDIGCSDSDHINIHVTEDNLSVTAWDSGDEIVCLGENANINLYSSVSGGIGALHYSWTPTTGLDNPNSPNPTATIGAGNYHYTLTITDSNGCSDSDRVNIHVTEDNLSVTAWDSGDEIVCLGENANINLYSSVSGGIGALHYSWTPTTGLDNPNSPNPTATIGAGNYHYTLTITDSNGCSDSDDVNFNVTEDNITVNITTDYVTCFADSATSTLYSAVTGGYPPYSYFWEPSFELSEPNAVNSDITFTESGIHRYTITVTDSIGCEAVDTIFLNICCPANGLIFCPQPCGVHTSCDSQSVIFEVIGGLNTEIDTVRVYSHAVKRHTTIDTIYFLPSQLGFYLSGDTLFISVNTLWEDDDSVTIFLDSLFDINNCKTSF